MAINSDTGKADPRVRTVALTGDELEAPEMVPEKRAADAAAFAQARSHLAQRLLDDVWDDAAALDVGLWGPSVTEVEADRTLREAIDRGAVYLDPPRSVAPSAPSLLD